MISNYIPWFSFASIALKKKKKNIQTVSVESRMKKKLYKDHFNVGPLKKSNKMT